MNFIKIKNFVYVSRLPIVIGCCLMYLIYILRVKNNIETINYMRCFSIFLCSIFGCVYNNYIDYDMDKKYKEDSNLLWDRNVLTKKDYVYYNIFLITSIIIYNLFYMPSYLILVGLYDCLINYLYSRFFKKTIFKNLFFVSSFTSSMYLEGYIMKYDINIMNYMLLLSLFYLPREIVLDINDYKGDKKFGLKTFPILFGKKISLYIVCIVHNIWFYFQYIYYNMNVIEDYTFYYNMYIYLCFISIFMYYYNKNMIEYGYCMKKIYTFYFSYHFFSFFIKPRITFVLHVYLCTRYLSQIFVEKINNKS